MRTRRVAHSAARGRALKALRIVQPVYAGPKGLHFAARTCGGSEGGEIGSGEQEEGEIEDFGILKIFFLPRTVLALHLCILEIVQIFTILNGQLERLSRTLPRGRTTDRVVN